MYFLHARDEALDKFMILKNKPEVHRKIFIKRLRSNRGDEYYDPGYFQASRIIYKVTTPYTP